MSSCVSAYTWIWFYYAPVAINHFIELLLTSRSWFASQNNARRRWPQCWHLEVIKAYLYNSLLHKSSVLGNVRATVAFIFVDSGVYGCLCTYNISSLFCIYWVDSPQTVTQTYFRAKFDVAFVTAKFLNQRLYYNGCEFLPFYPVFYMRDGCCIRNEVFA